MASQPGPSEALRRLSDPLCASAICRLKTSPMPDPPRLVVKNGTNKLAVFERPGPSSRTVISTLTGVCVVTHEDAAAGLLRGIHRVADQIDQHLLQLIRVPLNRHRGGILQRTPACAFRCQWRAAKATLISTGPNLGGGNFASRA